MFYKPLTRGDLDRIIDLQLASLNRRLQDRQLRCELTDEAKRFITDESYDPLYGARPLRRYLQHTVETMLAKRILRGDVAPGTTLHLDAVDGALCFRD